MVGRDRTAVSDQADSIITLKLIRPHSSWMLTGPERCTRHALTLPGCDGRLIFGLIIDIHTHTYPTSDDSLLLPDQLVEEAKRIGLDGICITDHDGFWNPDDILELSKRHDFLVLPGCEVTCEEGHLLVYGLQKYLFGMHRASFVRQLVDEAGGVMVVAHPYRRTYREEADVGASAREEMLERACRNSVFSMIDAVEVFNGRGSDQQNAFSHELATNFGMKGTGASDAHRLSEIGTYATEFHRPVHSLEDFIGELKAGRFEPVALRKRAGTAHPS